MTRVGKGVVVVICTLLAELAMLACAFFLFTSFVSSGSGGLGAVSFDVPMFVILLLVPAVVAGGVSMRLNRPQPHSS